MQSFIKQTFIKQNQRQENVQAFDVTGLFVRLDATEVRRRKGKATSEQCLLGFSVHGIKNQLQVFSKCRGHDQARILAHNGLTISTTSMTVAAHVTKPKRTLPLLLPPLTLMKRPIRISVLRNVHLNVHFSCRTLMSTWNRTDLRMKMAEKDTDCQMD